MQLASGLRLLAGYFPQKNAKAPFFNLCLEYAGRNITVPLLLIGDLNTGSNDLDLETGGAPFYCADLFSALSSQGMLVDLWRAEHHSAQEWSWRSQKNGFRIDHAFGNEDFLTRFSVTRCWYDHEPRQIGITDHSALLLNYIEKLR